MTIETSRRGAVGVRSVGLIVIMCALAAGACSRKGAAPSELGGAPPPAGDLSTVILSLTSVPSDVGCVRVSVTGAQPQPLVRTFDVTSGHAANLTMAGLPIGNATFYEDTFSGPCSGVNSNSPAT